MAPPLSKMVDGKRYVRPPEIDAAIDAILEASRDDIRRRLTIADPRDPEYLRPEVVLFLVRQSRRDNRDRWFDELYPALERRLARLLPRGNDVKAEDVVRRATKRFVDLLIADRKRHGDALDFFECRFAAGVAKLRAEAKRAVYQRGPTFTPLFDAGGGISDNVASAIERERISTRHPLDEVDFRSDLLAAIETLPENERRTATLMLKGLQDYDQDPTVPTISTQLKRSARMIQNYRNAAVEKLRRALVEDDQ